jgi:hypothetical protein
MDADVSAGPGAPIRRYKRTAGLDRAVRGDVVRLMRLVRVLLGRNVHVR